MTTESTMLNADKSIREQPNSSDPQEAAIRKLICKEFSSDFAKQEIAKMRELQLDFIAENISLDHDPHSVRNAYLDLMLKLAASLSEVKGRKIIDSLPSTGFVVATNHLAMPKATRFLKTDLQILLSRANLNLDLLPDEIEPFPIRMAAITKALKPKFAGYEIAIALPSPIDNLQRESGVVTISPTAGGRFEKMVDDVTKIFSEGTNSFVVTYPESGSTSKRGGGGLYGVAQEEFHTGFARLARQLRIPIVPIAQAFNPNQGFLIEILPTLMVPESADENWLSLKSKEVQKLLHGSLQATIKNWAAEL